MENAETITLKDLIQKYRDEIVVTHKAKKQQTTHKLNKLMRYDVAAQFILRLRSSHIYNFTKAAKRRKGSTKDDQYIRTIIASDLDHS